MPKTTDQAEVAKKSLLKHAAVLILMSLALQVIIGLHDNKIDALANILLASVAGYYLYYHVTSRKLLSQVRFARLVAHLLGFMIVNISYHLHAFALIVSNNNAIKGNENFPINSQWFGVLFGMTTFWGIGLIIHAVASIANRGFEELIRAS